MPADLLEAIGVDDASVRLRQAGRGLSSQQRSQVPPPERREPEEVAVNTLFPDESSCRGTIRRFPATVSCILLEARLAGVLPPKDRA